MFLFSLYSYEYILFSANKLPLYLLIFFSIIFTIFFIVSLKQTTIIKLNKKRIWFEKYFFIKERNVKEFVNVSEVEIVSHFLQRGRYVPYVEILFKGNKHFIFGSDLTKIERQYIIDELKLMYFKLKKVK